MSPKIKDKNKLAVMIEIFLVSLKLGLTSFGGPVAHLGYFHNEYIQKRNWMDERTYGNLVSLCQFLPGPASSQVGIGIGTMRAGIFGGVVAWIGFTLPSVLALVIFALLLGGFDISQVGWIHGLKIVAVAIVAQAVVGMGQKLTPDKQRITMAILAATIVLVWQTIITQVVVIALGALVGFILYRHKEIVPSPKMTVPVSRKMAIGSLIIFVSLFILLPVLRSTTSSSWVAMFDSFYRSGSLVFGGGHVVLPLLGSEVVSTGWIDEGQFLAGYGITQAMPGPLFTFAAYIGAAINGWGGAFVATIAIFLPSFLLVIGVLPFWSTVCQKSQVQGALAGVNAVVVGILLAALYDPIWTSSILSGMDFAFGCILFGMLQFWKLPPWSVVLVGLIGGMVFL